MVRASVTLSIQDGGHHFPQLFNLLSHSLEPNKLTIPSLAATAHEQTEREKFFFANATVKGEIYPDISGIIMGQYGSQAAVKTVLSQ